jgi:hypothetical protein
MGNRLRGPRIPPGAEPVFDQPAPGRKIESFKSLKSLANSQGSIFSAMLEADVTAIQIDDHQEQIAGV